MRRIPDEPWTYLWVGFAGEKAGEYLRDLGLGGERLIYQCACGDELKRIVFTMLENNTYTVANEYLLEGSLYQFFSVLARNLEIEADKRIEDDNLYIRKAVEYIQKPLFLSASDKRDRSLCGNQQELSLHSL